MNLYGNDSPRKWNFMTGVGSCMSIGGNYYLHDISPSPQHADAFAIHSDWKAVGQDFDFVMRVNPVKRRIGVCDPFPDR